MEKKPSKDNFKMFYALSVAMQFGFMFAVSVTAFFFAGLWADRKLGTEPLFIIVGIIAGLLAVAYEIRALIKILTKDHAAD